MISLEEDFKRVVEDNKKLQEENDRLKEIIENLTTLTVCGDRKQIKNTAQYKLDISQERINKAIEYIKNKKAIINTDYIRLFDLFKIEEQGYTDKLLSILKGSEE